MAIQTQTGPPPEVVKALHDDAALFAEQVLGLTLWSKQREILQSVSTHEKTVVKSCHGTGKTFISAAAVVWFLYTRSPAIVFTTAPTAPQVEKLLWKEINVAYGKLPPDLRALGRCLNTELKISAEHNAFGRATDDPENLQGLHSPHLMVVVDEACSVTDEMFNVIDTFAAGGEYRELYIGNPTSPSGRFYRAFQNEELGYNRISIPADVTPNWTGEDVPDVVKSQIIQQARVAKWAIEWGEDSSTYTARVKAEFPQSDATAVLVPLTWIEQAQQREPEYSADAVLQMGLDVARYGDDRSSLAWRKGRVLQGIESRAKLGTLEVAAWAGDEADAFAKREGRQVVVLVDEGGNPGVFDNLRVRSNPLVKYEAVSFGSSAIDPEKHSNRRNEMLWGLREYFKPGNNEPDMVMMATGDAAGRFVAQASTIRHSTDAKLRPKVESKDDMKKRKLPSPDELDAVALAFSPREKPSRVIIANEAPRFY